MTIDTDAVIQSQMRRALTGIAVFGGLATVWATLVPIDSAVVAPGLVAVENNSKKVQHQSGGIVSKILVVEGQRVESGELVVELDTTVARANLGVIMNDYTAQTARRDRLIAERDDAATITFQAHLLDLERQSEDVREKIRGETDQFNRRREARLGQQSQLQERIGQLRDEAAGLEKQRQASVKTLEVAREEMNRLAPLRASGLIQLPRLTALEREIARNIGQLGEMEGRIASARGRVTEIETQIQQITRDHKSEVAKDLREVETRLQDLLEKRSAAEDQLKRLEIRATASGVVHQLATHTVGGVITPADTIMNIVPDAQPLIIEGRINPQDIDRVTLRQAVRVRFGVFNQRTTPELTGEVFRLSRDVVRDPATNVFYYAVGIRIPEDEIKRLNGLKLMAGMPADSFIKTGSRTFASYLTKPITDVVPYLFPER